MRVAIAGAAAAAVLGGALAVAPLTVSNHSRTLAGGTCSAGQQCDKLASVLIPDAGKQSAMAARGAPAAVEPPQPPAPGAAPPLPEPTTAPAAYAPPGGSTGGTSP